MLITTTDRPKLRIPKIWRGHTSEEKHPLKAGSHSGFSHAAKVTSGRVLAIQEPTIITPDQEEVDLLLQPFDFNSPSMRLWKYNNEILNKLTEVMMDFREGKITGFPLYWLFATETEFHIALDTENNSSHKNLQAPLEERKKQLILEIRNRLEERISPGKREKLEKRLYDVTNNWTAKEMFLYELHENLRGCVEYRFGTETHQVGYYDTPGTCEVTMVPQEPIQAAINYSRLIKYLNDVLRIYGYRISMGSSHPNFSPNILVNGEYVSLYGKQDEANLELLQRSIAGIYSSFQEGSPFFLCRDQTDFGVGTSRDSSFRMCKNRAEFRDLNGNPLYLANLMLLTLGGAKAGLESKELLAPVELAAFADYQETEDTFYIKRVLQGCEINDSGAIISVPLEYFEMRYPQLIMDLVPANREEVMSKIGSSEYNVSGNLEYIGLPDIPKRDAEVLFKAVRIQPDGNLTIERNRIPESFRNKDKVIEAFSKVKCTGRFQTAKITLNERDKNLGTLDAVTRTFSGNDILSKIYGVELISNIASEMMTDSLGTAQRIYLKRPDEVKDNCREKDLYLVRLEELINKANERSEKGKTRLVHHIDSTISIIREFSNALEQEKSGNYDAEKLCAILCKDEEVGINLALNPSMIDLNEKIGILRPTASSFRQEPFGNRPMGAKEWAELKEQGRLYDVLRITAEKTKQSYPSICSALAIEMCKMDGGLKGPNRNEILFLGWQIIQQGYLYMLHNTDAGRKILKAMIEDGKLVDSIRSSYSFNVSEVDASTMCTLINAMVTENQGVPEHEKESFKLRCLDLIEKGYYELLGDEALQFLQKEGNIGLKALAKVYLATNEKNKITDICNLNDEIRRQITEIEIEKLDPDRSLAILLYELFHHQYFQLTTKELNVLRKHNNIGLRVLKEMFERNNILGSYLTDELLRQGYKDKAYEVYKITPRAYRRMGDRMNEFEERLSKENEAKNPKVSKKDERLHPIIEKNGFYSSKFIDEEQDPFETGIRLKDDEQAPRDQVVEGVDISPFDSQFDLYIATGRKPKKRIDNLDYLLPPEMFGIKLNTGNRPTSNTSNDGADVDYFKEVVEYGAEVLANKLYGTLDEHILNKMKERGDMAVEYCKRMINEKTDPAYYKLVLMKELVRQDRNEEFKLVIGIK